MDQDHTKELLAEIRQELIRITGNKVGVSDDPAVILTWALGAIQKIHGPKPKPEDGLPPHIRPDPSNPGIYEIDNGQIDRSDGQPYWDYLDTRPCSPEDLESIAHHIRSTYSH